MEVEIWACVEPDGRINKVPRLINKVETEEEAHAILQWLKKRGFRGAAWIDVERKAYCIMGTCAFSHEWLEERFAASSEAVVQ